MPKYNKYILMFSFFLSLLVSYEFKKYKLETFFGNNTKNFYQVENIYKFKKNDMMFDYAGSEQFKLIIYTNNLGKAVQDTEKFIDDLNAKMLRECRELKNLGKLDEFGTTCKYNRVFTSIQNTYLNKRFNFFKFIIIFLNIFLILSLINKIIHSIRFKKLI